MIVCTRFPVHPRTAAHAAHASLPLLPTLTLPLLPAPLPSYPHCYQPARTAATTNHSSDFQRLPPPRLHACFLARPANFHRQCLPASMWGVELCLDRNLFFYVCMFPLMLLLCAVLKSRDVTCSSSPCNVYFGNVCANNQSAIGLVLARKEMAYCGKMNIYANSGYDSSLVLLSCTY